MTTEAHQHSKPELNETIVKPTAKNMDAKVRKIEEEDQIILKTLNKPLHDTGAAANDKNAAADNKVKLSGGGTSNTNEANESDKQITAAAKSWFLKNSNMVSEYIHENCPSVEVFYEENMKSHFELLIETFTRIPTYYESYVRPNWANIQLIHSFCMIFWGGSWYSIALLLSFFNVYIDTYTNGILNLNIVEKYIQKIRDFSLSKFSIHSKMFEMKILKSAHEIWVLFVIFYAVWSVPFLASLTLALSTLKLVADTMISPEMTQYFEKPKSQLKVYSRWLRYAVFVFSAHIFVLLPKNIQASILMSCLGYQKLFSVVSNDFKHIVLSIKGPNNIDGITVTSWICVAISIVLQFFCGFQSSLFVYMVPLGLYLPGETTPLAKKEE
jgi:hypothetical protein